MQLADRAQMAADEAVKVQKGVARMPYKNPEDKVKYERARYQTHGEKMRAQMKTRYNKLYSAAKETVADSLGRPAECMKWMTSAYPTFQEECSGSLRIDHIGGNGIEEWAHTGTWKFYSSIVSGARDLSDLRLLCEFHNRWNNAFNRLRRMMKREQGEMVRMEREEFGV